MILREPLSHKEASKKSFLKSRFRSKRRFLRRPGTEPSASAEILRDVDVSGPGPSRVRRARARAQELLQLLSGPFAGSGVGGQAEELERPRLRALGGVPSQEL